MFSFKKTFDVFKTRETLIFLLYTKTRNDTQRPEMNHTEPKGTTLSHIKRH